MRGLALNVAALVLLFGALAQAKGELVVYEGFCYGDEERDLDGLKDECSSGWQGPWGVVTTATDAEKNWAHYGPGSLKFNALLLDVCPKDTGCASGGRAQIHVAHDYKHLKAVRQLAVQRPNTGAPYAISGSYLLQPRPERPLSEYSMVAMLVNKDPGGWNTTAEFFAAGDGWGTYLGSVGIDGYGWPNKEMDLTDRETYLVVFQVTGIDTNHPSITEWILNERQFEHFKCSDGWLTKEELNNAGLGTESDQVQQRQDEPFTRNYELMYPVDDYLGLMVYDGGYTLFGVEADFDELRISDSGCDIGLNEVTPIPEPSVSVPTVIALFALVAYARRKGRYRQPIGVDCT